MTPSCYESLSCLPICFYVFLQMLMPHMSVESYLTNCWTGCQDGAELPA